MQYWNPELKLNVEHNIKTNFGSQIFLDQNFLTLILLYQTFLELTFLNNNNNNNHTYNSNGFWHN